MKLEIYRSLWTNGFDLDSAIEDCRHGPFDGIEGPLPDNVIEREIFVRKIRAAGLPFIAEVTTGGGYVPRFREVERHLDEFRSKIAAACGAAPRFITALVGCDAWPIAVSIDFLGQAMAIAAEHDLRVSFETHRSRPTFNPWVTAEIVHQLPEIELTCDFSHWCCVCERLIMNEEPELLRFFASRARHVHGRVGYDQGPQVPHPAAPLYRAALESHEHWWHEIWNTQARSGFSVTTLTPEFGPDGYLQSAPFTGTPAGSLDEINHWMAARQRDRFNLQNAAATAASV
jgi:sugar phosphate isomerase/epimerase